MSDLHAARAILSELQARRLVGYDATLPGPLDERFLELARLYRAASAEERGAIRDMVPDDTRLILGGMSDRMATLALRRRDKALVAAALMAHVIEDFRHDPRENMIRLSIVHHVCKALKVGSEAAFAEAAAIASPRAAAELTAFAQRKEAMKSLKVMGLKEVMTPDGPGFAMR